MYVDGGASSEVLYEHCFVRLRPAIRSQMIPATTSLIGFSGETIWPICQISLLVKIGDEEHSTFAWMNFMVIRSPSQHNGIIGRTGIRKIHVVPSTTHGMLKFPVKGGTVTIRSNRVIPMECAMISGPNTQHPVTSQVLEEKIKMAIHPDYPEQTIAIGSTLTEKGRKELCALLRQNLDVFSWKPADMTGVPRHMAEHRLNVREGCPPVRQKKKGQAPKRNKAIQEEVEKLVDAGIIKEVHYHGWLSNPFMEGMFLGYKVNAEGLKVCPDKADAVLSLPSPEAEIAFKQMKKLIAELPMLTAPKEKEELIIYLAAAKEAISAVIMTERGGKQFPVYFVSRALRGPKINYTPMEKLVLALLSASRRLKRPRTSIKGQILADFIVERPDEESPDELMAEPKELPEPWTLFTDGSSCIDGSGAGLILTNPEGVEFTYAMRFRFVATNNEAEYEALIAGLRIVEQMDVKNLQENVDSRLVANQVSGSYVAKESVPRSENKKADALSKIASTSFAHLSKQVLMEELKEKSIHEKEVLVIVEEEGQTWMTPICEYLKKKSFLGPWLRCVGPLQRNYILREIHKGSCSMHSGPRSVVAKAIQTRYYWPTMHMDARKIIRECNDCQVHRPIPRNPQQNLTPITSPWLFYKWGIDIDGPFLEGPDKVKFLTVAIDYFTKWIEAKPVATITGNQVKKFVWNNNVCRFGLPGEIVSNNEKQFRDNPFKDWCKKLCIHQCFAFVKHPQANGLVERANRSLGEGIKAG
ncbi:reverse transcriptase domain-containing protein, partial [Tanacetum coccineum]